MSERSREAIERTARKLYDADKKGGGNATYEQCRERVQRAVNTGDNKRANGNK